MKIVLIRGGGDLASGIALRLHRCGYQVIITELPEPLSVRRAVSFSEAVYEGQWQVEEVTAKRVETAEQLQTALQQGEIPVIVDPDLALLSTFNRSRYGLSPYSTSVQPSNPSMNSGRRLQPFDTASPVRPGFSTVIDARLTKRSPDPLPFSVPLHIGIGPGFVGGENCDAVIESQRGHTLGRVIWHGPGQPDSGLPEGEPGRVLRSPADGTLIGYAQIGDHVEPGQIIAEVDGQPILAPFPGVLRGLIRPGIYVPQGMKVGDLDKRDNREYCFLVSEKALAISGGVLEAILTHQTKDQGQ
jgi:xanthine dehydrogenase accessory factor